MFRRDKQRNARVKRPRRSAPAHAASGVVTGPPKKDWSRARLLFVAGCFALVWGGLWGRAYMLQVHKGERLAALAKRQHEVAESRTGQRGRILDRNGRLLATDLAFRSVYARPVQIADRAGAARELASALGMSASRVSRLLNKERNFVWVARQVNDRAAEAVRKAGIRGVYLTREFGRQYPNKALAGRLLGFVGVDDRGLEGLEAAFQEWLVGGSASYTVHRDAAGRRLYMDAQGNEVSVRGNDLRLTVDANVQFAAEEALARTVEKTGGKWGGCIVVDVRSGDILAWGEYPAFNPNAYSGYKASQWRSRNAVDAMEPGSTIKPFLIAAALDEGIVTPETLVNCENGKWRVGGVTIRDTHKYDEITVREVLMYSSNIGCAKIGLEMGREKWHDWLARLGFGERTGLPFPGEARGILRPARKWYDADLAATSFGQGFSASMAQMAQAFLTLANHGVMRPLKLIIEGPERERAPERRIFSREASDTVLKMMGEVVENGTGRSARIQGLSVGGKTGTAQKASAEGGYGDEYVGSFVGLFPAEDPEYLVLVAVDEPQTSHYGSQVAAPAFREVTLASMAYLREMPVNRQVRQEMAEQAVIRADNISMVVAGRVQPADTPAVPDFTGWPLRRAVEVLHRRGLVPDLKGDGTVVSKQIPRPGTPWPPQAEGTETKQTRECVLWLTP